MKKTKIETEILDHSKTGVKLMRCISLLNRIQWSEFGWDECPSCGYSRAEHYEECALKALLEDK